MNTELQVVKGFVEMPRWIGELATFCFWVLRTQATSMLLLRLLLLFRHSAKSLNAQDERQLLYLIGGKALATARS